MNGLTFWSIVALQLISLAGIYQLGRLHGSEKTRAHYEWIRQYFESSDR